MKKTIKILSPIVIIIGLYFFFRTEEIILPSGILAPENPAQLMLDKSESWQIDDFSYTSVATFNLKAKVLNIRFYGSDDMSDFSPVDIAVGWGKMSNQDVVNAIDIKQQHRWYVWQAKIFPIPRKEIEKSSTNIHIIPSNDEIEDIVDKIIKGNIIELSGKLVNVNKLGNKWSWNTSTKRSDTGGGACEILWLENVKILM